MLYMKHLPILSFLHQSVESDNCMVRWLPVACLMILLVPGCTLVDAPLPKENQTNIAAVPAETSALPSMPQETPTATLQRTTYSQPTLSTPDSAGEICSPLFGFQLSQLQDIISTPFDAPVPGSDGGHHGIDFGFYTYGAFTTMENLPVQSILNGTIAAVIADRPPYGNMVIIETPFSSLPRSWQKYLDSLPALDEYQPDGRLACPTLESSMPSSGERSLYLLYAHLAETPSLLAGDPINCGQQFGLVGNTGFSGNAHLHLETRLGPAGVQFLHLAHYVNNASPEEMANYCTWRVSQYFRLINPLELLLAEP